MKHESNERIRDYGTHCSRFRACRRVSCIIFNTGAEDFNALIRPLSAAGGKRLRAQLCLLIANAGTSIERQRIKIAEAVEMLHLATLIHDDVLDQAEIRRGRIQFTCIKAIR